MHLIIALYLVAESVLQKDSMQMRHLNECDFLFISEQVSRLLFLCFKAHDFQRYLTGYRS